jgi:hypothetical protein
MSKIVNADDFGYSADFNKAIVLCFKQGIVSSTTIMMNMPSCDEAIDLALQNGFSDSIGLHFNIIEGLPLSERIKHCERLCKDGVLCYKRNSVFLWSDDEKLAIKEEFEAQLKALISKGIIPTHVDSHQHSHTEIPIFNIIKEPMHKAGIKKVRLSRNVGLSRLRVLAKSLINSYFRSCGFVTTKYFNDIVQFEKNIHLDNIEIMCHPTMINGEIKDAIRGINIIKQADDLINYSQL